MSFKFKSLVLFIKIVTKLLLLRPFGKLIFVCTQYYYYNYIILGSVSLFTLVLFALSFQELLPYLNYGAIVTLS